MQNGRERHEDKTGGGEVGRSSGKGKKRSERERREEGKEGRRGREHMGGAKVGRCKGKGGLRTKYRGADRRDGKLDGARGRGS